MIFSNPSNFQISLAVGKHERHAPSATCNSSRLDIERLRLEKKKLTSFNCQFYILVQISRRSDHETFSNKLLRKLRVMRFAAHFEFAFAPTMKGTVLVVRTPGP